MSIALASLLVVLSMGGCSGERDIHVATTAFGDAIGRFKGDKASAAIAAYGEPTRRTARADGQSELVWKRNGTVFRHWQFVPQDCTLTMLAGADGIVRSVVAGGNSLYCADQFGG